MFVTINGLHFNMAYFSAFGWVDGEVRYMNDAGQLKTLADPDKIIYLHMCEKAGVEPVKSAEEEINDTT